MYYETHMYLCTKHFSAKVYGYFSYKLDSSSCNKSLCNFVLVIS